ncbi:MAG: hypothetical protein GWP06_05890 [Actinobacteria bacterium]|nr:hypothetical protein [Actinomycetota bacterium]
MIEHPLPHPQCDAKYLVLPEDHFLSLRHAQRLGLVDRRKAKTIVRTMIPGCEDSGETSIRQRIEYLN